jgi:hypothetical protein
MMAYLYVRDDGHAAAYADQFRTWRGYRAQDQWSGPVTVVVRRIRPAGDR